MGTLRAYETKADKPGKKPVTRWTATIRMKGTCQSRTFSTKTQAQTWMESEERKIRKEMQEGTYDPNGNSKRTVKDAIDHFRERNYDEGFSESWKYALRDVEAYLGKYKLTDLKLGLILDARESYRNSRPGNPYAPSTCNKFTTALGRVLKKARVEWGWMTTNPMVDLEKISEEGNKRERWLLDDERDRLLEEAGRAQNPCLKYVILVALGTGYRKDVVKNLKWSQIDLTKKVFLVPKAFNSGRKGKPRAVNVPIIPSLLAVLVDHWKVTQLSGVDSPYVFPSPKNPSQSWDFTKAFNNAVDRAKIEDFTFHDLRHSTASYLARENVPLHVIQVILGHSNPVITMRYIKHADEHLAKEMERALDDKIRRRA